jgi:hypothetical protein
MNKFIHRENVALFRRRLDDPGLSDAQREAILRLLSEERQGPPDHVIDGGSRPVDVVSRK